MSSLSNQKKQLLFDYCSGLTSEKETAEAEALISSNEQAAEIHSKLKASLSPLDNVTPEPCPDELAESTVARLNNLAGSSHVRLEQLISAEQARPHTTSSRTWWSFGKIAAAAAVILVVAAILFPSFDFLRYNSRLSACQMGLNRIFQGITNYSSDHNGQIPTVVIPAGAPWWKVGYQGKENHSAPRSMWLLVKGNYVDPAVFVCPGKKQASETKIDPCQIQTYNDFPSRAHITYSIRIRCSTSATPRQRTTKILISDLSPLFENLPADYSQPFNLELDQKLFNLNSANHGRNGQNVLFCNGAVKFMEERYADISKDDIFTLQGMCIGCKVTGCETPASDSDTLLAP